MIVDEPNYIGVTCEVMARPRTINPKGNTRTTSVVLPEDVHARLTREAERRGVTLGQVIRERVTR